MGYHVIYQFIDSSGTPDKMCLSGISEEKVKKEALSLIKSIKGKSPKILKEMEKKDFKDDNKKTEK